MINIGTVTGQEIKKNRNGEVDVRLLSVRMSNDSDIQTVQYFNPSGEDSAPIDGDQVLVFSLGPAFKVAITSQDALAAVTNAGEKKSYSRDSNGDIAAFINLLVGGNVELNGNSRSAVGYEDLVTEFNELKNVVNAHTHLYTPGTGTPTQTAVGTPQSAADITTTESPTVKLP